MESPKPRGQRFSCSHRPATATDKRTWSLDDLDYAASDATATLQLEQHVRTAVTERVYLTVTQAISDAQRAEIAQLRRRPDPS